MQNQRVHSRPSSRFIGLLTLLGAVGLAMTVPMPAGASTPTVLVRDTFDANTGNTNDLNADLSRQSGTLAPISYTLAGGPTLYGHQLQNGAAPNQLLLADFANSTSSLNLNFNGLNSAGGLIISFDLDSVPTTYNGTPDNWGCINLGLSQADQLANVNQGVPHFGILFRAAGTLQAFDGAGVVSPNPEPIYTSRGPGTTNHIELVITDADGNPFDGSGDTKIDVYVNGGTTPVWSYTKTGGYANNYINLQGSFRAHFDNLALARRGPEIINPSFEADNFTVFPGYVSGNGPITGWASPGGHGVNPGTFGGPFTDNGQIPDGTKAAFLQEDGALRQTIGGFGVGATYQIVYYENARNGTAPSCEVTIAGKTIDAVHSVPPVGGSNPYRRRVTDAFVATATSMELAFIKSNPQGGDTTLLIDNVGFLAAGTPPTITTQPKDLIVAFGEPATLSAEAVGSAPLSYQWYFASAVIPGASSPTYSVASASAANTGDYFVVASNPSGSATSLVAHLTVLGVVPGLFNTGVDSSGAALPDGSPDTHFKLIVNPDNTGDTPLVEDSTVFPIVGGPWVANNAGSKWIGPRLETSGSAGGSGAAGDYTYRVTLDLSGANPASVVVVGDWGTDNEGLDILVNGQSTGQHNTVQFAGLTSFSLSGIWLAGINTIDFKLNNSAVGYTGLRLDHFRALGTALPAGTPPSIALQPQSVTAPLGEPVTFTVRAQGSGPLSYQWYLGATAIPGETNPTLSFILDAPARAGAYSVQVSSAFGSVRSDTATLTLREAPAIITQPQSQTVALGANVTFSVVANGAEPFTYQWSKNGAPIPGATTASLTLTSVTANDAGSYTVNISNFAGAVTSDPAVLVVLQAITGLFSTGVDASGAALADGAVDPHYRLVVNPDGASNDALVEDSTAFPIVAGPWVPNSPDSKWIGPRLDTTAAAGGAGASGDYTYRITFDLTGFDPASVRITGEWATDNQGEDIIINGTSTGQKNTTQFGGYTAFSVTTGFVAGQNALEFKLNNSDVGWTGLRVRNIGALGLPANENPVARITVTPLLALGTPGDNLLVLSINNSDACVTLDGSASSDEEGDALTYAWFIDGSTVPAASGVTAPACLELGEHQITLVVTDAAGGTGQATVTVEVITGSEATDELIELVNNADIERKNKRPFIATLKAVSASFDRGSIESALGQLHAFQNKVRAQVGQNDPAQAVLWIRSAQSIIDSIESQR